VSFPWIHEANHERGDNADYDSETDTGSQLDFPHYTDLARFPWPHCAPYSGAYCMRVTLAGGTADAYVVEGDWDIAATVNRFCRFNIWFSPTFDATADDTVAIWEFLATATVETSVGFRYVATTDVINLGIGEVAPTSFGSAIEKGVWYTVELDMQNDPGSNDGTIDMYVTKAGDPASTVVDATQVASLDQGAVTTGRLGVQDHLATTTGVILIDDVIFDDARIYPGARYPTQKTFTKSGHFFIGSGDVASAALLTDEATNKVLLYDTNTADTLSDQDFVAELELDNQTSISGPIHFEKGCYVELSGTDPRAQVTIVTNSDVPGAYGPSAYDDSGVRWHGLLA